MFEFRKLLDKLPIGVVLINLDEEIIYANEAAAKITGYTLKEIDNLNQWYIKMFQDEEKITTVKKNFQKKLAGTLEKDYFTIKTKTGQNKHIDFSLKKINSDYILISFLDVTEKIEYRKEIEYLSFHDELTGLYNRRFFNAEFDRLNNSRQYPISIIVADLNNLKEINDNYGHKIGDKFIKKSADLLENSLRDEDILARVGGDEFMILLPKTNHDEVEIIVNRIKEKFRLINSKDVLSWKLNISLGVSTANSKAEDLNVHIAKADKKMYRNKEDSSG
ncbi:MAG: sensor domain-containing diguanylate cyclase [Halanaerobium sp. MSAO_Bac5]|nr:MAG: sensor domain-containing diguanylate cyclase [Halanaerobium sp. MSAO_Bac5]